MVALPLTICTPSNCFAHLACRRFYCDQFRPTPSPAEHPASLNLGKSRTSETDPKGIPTPPCRPPPARILLEPGKKSWHRTERDSLQPLEREDSSLWGTRRASVSGGPAYPPQSLSTMCCPLSHTYRSLLPIHKLGQPQCLHNSPPRLLIQTLRGSLPPSKRVP